MKIKYLLAASVVSLSAAATIATPAAAQQITSGVEGTVSDEAGNALPGATITITDQRTAQTRTATAGANGSFRVQSLPPGGPYTVTVTADGFEGQTVENVFTNISGNTGFTFTLTESAAGNVIVVTGARGQPPLGRQPPGSSPLQPAGSPTVMVTETGSHHEIEIERPARGGDPPGHQM